MRAMRIAGYSYILNLAHELINLASRPEHRNTLRKLRFLVRRWRRATRDPRLEGQTSAFEHPH